MNRELSQSLSTISRMSHLIPEILKTENHHERVTGLTTAFRTLWPGCGLFACLLHCDCNSCGTILDVDGIARDDWRDCLHGILRSPITELPTTLPNEIALPDHVLAMEWITGSGQRGGLCALGIPSRMPEEIAAIARTFLAESAMLLGLYLRAESLAREERRLTANAAELAWMANLGELAGPLIHQFNNFLNVCMLNVILMERQLDPSFRPDLESIRRQGTETAALVRHLQHNREKERPSPHEVDLNEAVDEWLSEKSLTSPGHILLASGEVHVRFEPTDLPAIVGSVPDLKRLLHFLLSQSAAANDGEVEVRIQTGATADHVWLRVEDSGPAVSPELLPHLFESQKQCRPGVDQLKLAACKSLVRRLRGEIRAEVREGSGLAITVVLPISEPAVL
jgi:signal transduction histidine kinase